VYKGISAQAFASQSFVGTAKGRLLEDLCRIWAANNNTTNNNNSNSNNTSTL